jgi:hypothetical protein
MKKALFLLSIMLLLTSCSDSVTIQLDPEVNVFLSNDRKQNITLTPLDKEYASLNEWLRTHSSGWHSTSGRYPGGVYLKSGNYGIQVTDAHVVIYSTTSQEPKAIYIQKVGKGELSDILNIGKH